MAGVMNGQRRFKVCDTPSHVGTRQHLGRVLARSDRLEVVGVDAASVGADVVGRLLAERTALVLGLDGQSMNEHLSPTNPHLWVVALPSDATLPLPTSGNSWARPQLDDVDHSTPGAE